MMITIFGIFVKFITYSLASSFIVCRILAQQYNDFDCKQLNTECSTIVCQSEFNKTLILPIDSFPVDICHLIIIIYGNGSLAITSVDMFHKLPNLQSLEIRTGRSLQITEKLLNSNATEHLKNVLFNLPKLKTLSLEYNEFNRKNYSWTLSSSLEKLYLSNGTFEFDLRNCSRLSSLRLNYNELRKMPYFHRSLTQLETLDLMHNPLDEFTVNDLADFCQLYNFTMDVARITNCECKKLKQWIIKLKEWNFTYAGDLECNNTVDNFSNCTLEDAMLRREKCMLGKWKNNEPILDLMSKLKKAEWEFDGFTIFLIIIVCILICCYCCSCIGYMLFKKFIAEHGFGSPAFGMPQMGPGLPYGGGGGGYGYPY